MRGILLDTHASTATITLLPTPELAIDELLIDFHTGRNARENGNQRLSVGLSSSAETKHKRSILQERRDQLVETQHAASPPEQKGRRESPASVLSDLSLNAEPLVAVARASAKAMFAVAADLAGRQPVDFDTADSGIAGPRDRLMACLGLRRLLRWVRPKPPFGRGD